MASCENEWGAGSNREEEGGADSNMKGTRRDEKEGGLLLTEGLGPKGGMGEKRAERRNTFRQIESTRNGFDGPAQKRKAGSWRERWTYRPRPTGDQLVAVSGGPREQSHMHRIEFAASHPV